MCLKTKSENTYRSYTTVSIKGSKHTLNHTVNFWISDERTTSFPSRRLNVRLTIGQIPHLIGKITINIEFSDHNFRDHLVNSRQTSTLSTLYKIKV